MGPSATPSLGEGDGQKPKTFIGKPHWKNKVSGVVVRSQDASSLSDSNTLVDKAKLPPIHPSGREEEQKGPTGDYKDWKFNK